MGTVEQYAVRAAALKAVDALRLHVNKETPRSVFQPLTCEQLIAHYAKTELPEGNLRKAYSTKAVYKCYLDNWVLPRWRSYRLSEVKTVAVEEWLAQSLVSCGNKGQT